MTDYELIKQNLEEQPGFRERRFRSKGLMVLALKETGLENRYKDKLFIDIHELASLAIKFESLNRTWRDVLADDDNAYLRGTDYFPKKEILEQEKQLALGYRPMEAQIAKANARL